MYVQVALFDEILGLTRAAGGHVSERLGGARLHGDVGLGGVLVHRGG
jgi:nitrate/nitrite transporter NarK